MTLKINTAYFSILEVSYKKFYDSHMQNYLGKLNPTLPGLLNTRWNGGGGVFYPLLIRLFLPQSIKIWYVESTWYYLSISILKFVVF